MNEGRQEVLATLRDRQRAGDLNLFRDSTIADYVAGLPRSERVPALVMAYRGYREAGLPPEVYDREHSLVWSAYSIVISQILGSLPSPTEDETCKVLKNSFHYCGHGGDVMAPIRLAESAFANRPYSAQLFDAAREYRRALQGLNSVQAQMAKQELAWILWHDGTRPEKLCWTQALQLGIGATPAEEQFAWQWMLRHTLHTLSPKRGKAWLAEAERRLSQLGLKTYRERIDVWVRFPAGEGVRLSPAGSVMLRALVYYAKLAGGAGPVFSRLDSVEWADQATARKVMAAWAWTGGR